MASRLLPLRILYTINSSPQYILARSHKQVPVSPITQRPPPNSHYIHTFHDPSQPVSSNPLYEIYATASLKTCLDIICHSSPELVQDDTRDFSVYVLDPLESQSTPAPVNIPANASTSHSDSSVASATDQHPRAVAVGLGLMSWALLADDGDCISVTGTLLAGGTGQEALQVIFALRETTPLRKAALPSTVKSWGLPPPPSKRTRVHASKSHHSSKHPSSSKHATSTRPSSSFRSAYGLAGSTSSQPQPNTIYSRKYSTSSDPQQSSSSGSVTSDLLDSHSLYIGPPRRPVGRPDTGRGKVKVNKKDTHSLLMNTPFVHRDDPNHATEQPELSNPIPQTNGEPSLMDLLAAISSSGQNAALLSALSAIDSSAGPSLPSHPHADAPNPALVSALKQLLSMACSADNSADSITSPPLKADRTQDDDIVLLEKENVNPTAFRRRAQKEDAKDSSATAVPDASRARFGVGSKENSSPTSATRKRTLSEFMDERGDGRQQRTGGISSQGRSYSHPQTSPPVRSDENSIVPPGSCLTRPRKRFIVPDWAKTETATLPRLSKEPEGPAVETLEGKGKKAKKTGDGRASPSGLRNMAGKVASIEPKDGCETWSSYSGSQNSDISSSTVSTEVPENVWAPATANGSIRHFPVFASDISVGSFPATFSSPPSSPSPCSGELPKTPTRKGLSPNHDKISSLFTPTPKSGSSPWLRGLYDNSPLFDPRFRSMVGLSRQVSPTRVVLLGKIAQGRSKQVETETEAQGPDSSDDLDFPPTSLPIASSDVDLPKTTLSEDQDGGDFDQDNTIQHWSGLPPSSPPPPSSPVPPAHDDEKIEDLPSTAGNLPSEFGTDFDFSNDAASRETNLEMSFDQFNILFSGNGADQAFFPLGSSDGVVDSAVQNGMTDFDFTEFWESVKPLVEGESGNLKVFGAQQHDGSSGDIGSEIDHAKLAEEVQALFSGCLM